MNDTGLRRLEDIVIAISNADSRIIGFTSPDTDLTVISIASSTAEFFARSGRSVLLIDVQHTVTKQNSDMDTVTDALANWNVLHKGQGLDIIAVNPTSESRYAFSDSARVKAALQGFLDRYQFVFIVMGPVVGTTSTLNPLPLGAACDHVLLVCRRGFTRRSQLRSVVDRLRSAHCMLGGIVLNETGYAGMSSEIEPLLSWIFWPVPWLRKRVRRWALNSDLLN